MARMLVIADDLTGAADCAAPSAAVGCSALVLLHSPDAQESETGWPDTDILSIDANTRSLPAEQASKSVTRLVRLCDSHNAPHLGYVLFKKIDSTLRGNVAAELSALLNIRRSTSHAKLSILMAPALPAQGRTTVGGRLLVHGVPLEKTDIWQSEARTAQSDISHLVSEGGLSCGLIDLPTVRSGSTALHQAILQTAKQNDVVLCDAETDGDLHAVAEASVGQPAIAALVGSAGLACQIPRAIGIVPTTEPHEWSFAAGPTLFVVGTPASVSRQQARILETTSDIAAFHTTTADISNSSTTNAQVLQTLESGRDVLLTLAGNEHHSKYEEQGLPREFSELLSRCSQLLGGIVLTGGETARAVLEVLAIRRLRLLGEVESGLPFAIADGWARPLPIITKAGAFGSPQALVHCRDFLKKLEHVRAGPLAEDPLLNQKI